MSVQIINRLNKTESDLVYSFLPQVLDETILYLTILTAAGVVPCGSCKKSSHVWDH